MTRETTRTSIYLEKDLKERVHSLAREEERSLSNLVSILLKEALKHRDRAD